LNVSLSNHHQHHRSGDPTSPVTALLCRYRPSWSKQAIRGVSPNIVHHGTLSVTSFVDQAAFRDEHEQGFTVGNRTAAASTATRSIVATYLRSTCFVLYCQFRKQGRVRICSMLLVAVLAAGSSIANGEPPCSCSSRECGLVDNEVTLKGTWWTMFGETPRIACLDHEGR